MNVYELTRFYFTDFFSLVCIFSALLASIKSPNKKELRPIRFYVYISFAFNFILYFGSLIVKSVAEYETAMLVSMNIYTLVECTLLAQFIISKSVNNTYKKILTTIYLSFVLFWFYILIQHLNFITKSASIMAGIEAFIVILLCLVSFKSMISKNIISTFMKSSEFYILVGTMGYFSFAIPYFLGISLVNYYAPKVSIIFECLNMLLIGGFFLFIKKGFYATRKG